jgi:hypothetical protein
VVENQSGFSSIFSAKRGGISGKKMVVTRKRAMHAFWNKTNVEKVVRRNGANSGFAMTNGRLFGFLRGTQCEKIRWKSIR